MSDITRILSQIESGDQKASEQLLPVVYDELRKLAAARMADERVDHTLQATALVHEAYVRLVDTEQDRQWDSRGHFFSAAAEAMRRILIESARRKKRLKREGDRERLELADDLAKTLDGPQIDLIDFNEALEQLVQEDEQVAELVKLRIFAGLSLTEAGKVLGWATSTAHDHWRFARTWFAYRLQYGE